MSGTWEVATMKFYNLARGYGFVTCHDGIDAFVHVTTFKKARFVAAPPYGTPVEILRRPGRDPERRAVAAIRLIDRGSRA